MKSKREIKGFSDPRVLRECRAFYRLYPQIRGSLTREFSGGLLGLPEIRQRVPADFGGPGISAPATAERLQRFLEADRARIEALTDGSPSEPARTPKKSAARPARKK